MFGFCDDILKSIFCLEINRILGVDEQAWKGLKETAGSSSQVRNHIGDVRRSCSFYSISLLLWLLNPL